MEHIVAARRCRFIICTTNFNLKMPQRHRKFGEAFVFTMYMVRRVGTLYLYSNKSNVKLFINQLFKPFISRNTLDLKVLSVIIFSSSILLDINTIFKRNCNWKYFFKLNIFLRNALHRCFFILSFKNFKTKITIK